MSRLGGLGSGGLTVVRASYSAGGTLSQCPWTDAWRSQLASSRTSSSSTYTRRRRAAEHPDARVRAVRDRRAGARKLINVPTRTPPIGLSRPARTVRCSAPWSRPKTCGSGRAITINATMIVSPPVRMIASASEGRRRTAHVGRTRSR
jgi:hypothetical protein